MSYKLSAARVVGNCCECYLCIGLKYRVALDIQELRLLLSASSCFLLDLKSFHC